MKAEVIRSMKFLMLWMAGLAAFLFGAHPLGEPEAVQACSHDGHPPPDEVKTQALAIWAMTESVPERERAEQET
jgi:hypothetical protein